MKKILITVLIIITSAPLWAGPVKLSLEDAIRICETENLLLSAQKEELRGEEAKTKQIEGLTKGSLDITGGYTRLDDDITMALDPGALPFTVPDVTLGPKDQVHLIASYVAP
ncbi:MAG: hypothetical protein ILO36_01885, partial [Abditibacteriota bacterium]|nr:hypothetical protein [Abditibacteriota bacterium]